MTGPRKISSIDAGSQDRAEKRRLTKPWRRGWKRPFRPPTPSMSPSRRPPRVTITSSGGI